MEIRLRGHITTIAVIFLSSMTFTVDLKLDQLSSDNDNHDFAFTYNDGKWGDSDDTGGAKYLAICSYVVAGTAP